MYTQSIGAFIQNLLLYFTENDISSLCINDIYYAKNEIEQYFNSNYELISGVAIGYSNFSKKYNMRKSLNDILL